MIEAWMIDFFGSTLWLLVAAGLVVGLPAVLFLLVISRVIR